MAVTDTRCVRWCGRQHDRARRAYWDAPSGWGCSHQRNGLAAGSPCNRPICRENFRNCRERRSV